MAQEVRFLSADDVARALPMAEAVEGMKAAYAQLSTGQADMPLRARVQGDGGVTLVMPAHLQQSAALGVKVVSVFPQNTARGLPIIHALVLALDAGTGRPLAIMEGGSLTAIRTGAGAGAATDLLARPDAHTVAIIGSGVQARTQLEAVCTVRSISTVYVYSPTRAHAERFAADMAGRGPIPTTIHVTAAADEAVAAADIVCTATTSSTPVFNGAALRPGAHINAVGSYTPQMQELDEAALRGALIVMDSREAVLAEAGEVIIALQNGAISESDLHAELGQIVAGQKSGRSSPQQITYFKSCGVAVQDAAAAQIALRNAEAQGLGTLLAL